MARVIRKLKRAATAGKSRSASTRQPSRRTPSPLIFQSSRPRKALNLSRSGVGSTPTRKTNSATPKTRLNQSASRIPRPRISSGARASPSPTKQPPRLKKTLSCPSPDLEIDAGLLRIANDHFGNRLKQLAFYSWVQTHRSKRQRRTFGPVLSQFRYMTLASRVIRGWKNEVLVA
jgi:hypothetical protein